jgi:recombination protein RecA
LLVDLAEQTGVITRKGAWYSYNGDNIAQGRDNSIKYLEDNSELIKDIEQKVRQKLEMGAVVAANTVSRVDAEDVDVDDEMLEED